MRRDGGDLHENRGLKRISCASQFTIPETAGTTPDRAGNNINTRSSKPHQPSGTPGFPVPLVSSIWFSSASPIPHFLVHNSTIIAEHKVKSSLSICRCHGNESTPRAAYTGCNLHPVQHTPSTAYTEYSIHRVQHTPQIACRPFSLTIS